MRAYGSGDLTPLMAVLGLISQGRSTAAALHGRLDSEFPHANYAPNTAHTGLARLAQKGHVRLVSEGEAPPQDVYEVTELGLAHFEEWLYEIAIVPTPLRDPLHGKLTFIGLSSDGMERLIETVRAFEEAAARNYGSEHGKINTLSISGLDGNPRLELQRIRLKYTATVWGQEAKRLASLRRELEEFQTKVVRSTG